ncbi:unnamed protein product [Medioppia subpectinata]|uniref:Serine protease n=1 Tax=Medioppia subpectinata TaxID=1979941 RepID=A0A7R9KH83_9ACAR|nr:unnamed protein product [Medioppia subpectinata]CAG2103376.1 unnamed protein product [Medioppia subpectinata]
MKTMREKYSMDGKRYLGVALKLKSNTFWVMSSAINRPLNVSENDLQINDWIEEINGKPVESFIQLEKESQSLRDDQPVPLMASIPAIIAGNDWYEYIRHNNTTKSHTNSSFKPLITTRIAHLLNPLAKEEITQVGNLALPSVVMVVSKSMTGVGTVVDKSGLIITNCHVVADSQYVNVKFTAPVEAAHLFHNKQTVTTVDVIKGRVVYCQPDKDLAVIRVYVKEDSLPALVLSDRQELKPGEPVLVFGYPDLSLSTTVGVLKKSDPSNNVNVNSLLMGRHMEHLAPTAPGFSGGPILDGKGAVVGIHTGRSKFTGIGSLATDANEINGNRLNSFTQLDEELQSLSDRKTMVWLTITRRTKISVPLVASIPAIIAGNDWYEYIRHNNTTKSHTNSTFKSSLTTRIAHLLDPLATEQIKQVYNQSLPSVVMVFTKAENNGTGFVVDKSGLIITNCHVVEDWQYVYVQLTKWVEATDVYPNYKTKGLIHHIRGRVVYCQPDMDLAVIRLYVKKNALPALVLSDRQDLKPGEPVLLFGFPDKSWSTAPGVLKGSDSPSIAIDVDYNYSGKNFYLLGRHVEHLTPSTQGFSGGPILDGKGVVIGIESCGLFTGSGPLATDATGMSTNELLVGNGWKSVIVFIN